MVGTVFEGMMARAAGRGTVSCNRNVVHMTALVLNLVPFSWYRHLSLTPYIVTDGARPCALFSGLQATTATGHPGLPMYISVVHIF